MNCGHGFYQVGCYSCNNEQRNREHKQRMRQSEKQHRERMRSPGRSILPDFPMKPSRGPGVFGFLGGAVVVILAIPVILLVLVVGAAMSIASGMLALAGLVLHSLFWALAVGAIAGAGTYAWRRRDPASRTQLAYARPDKELPVVEQVRSAYGSLDPSTAFALKTGAGAAAVVFCSLFFF